MGPYNDYLTVNIVHMMEGKDWSFQKPNMPSADPQMDQKCLKFLLVYRSVIGAVKLQTYRGYTFV